MKKLIPVLAVSFAFVAVGIAGFFVCDATKTQPLIRAINRANTAREVRIQEISRVLADSIAATEAWLSQEKAEQIEISQKAVVSFIEKFGEYSQTDEARALYKKQEEDARNERLPYMIRTRRHINWMKQEMEWLRQE